MTVCALPVHAFTASCASPMKSFESARAASEEPGVPAEPGRGHGAARLRRPRREAVRGRKPHEPEHVCFVIFAFLADFQNI